jgi:hypothetical protein
MNTIPALRTAAIIAADVTFTSNVIPASVGLVSPIGTGQTQKLRYWIPVTVGATGGLRAQVVVPAGGTIFEATIKLYNTVAPSLTTAIQNASAAFTNALANAGSHWLEIEVVVVNGNTAGNVDLQMAQNTSDVLTLTVLRGGFVEVVKI